MNAWTRGTTQVLGALLACLVPVIAPATDARTLILEHLSTLDGLPQGTVYVTLQDSQGFVWFGTEDGLVRYDGHDIYRYAYSPNDKGTLPGNFVFAIVEDSHSDLWIGIKGAGLARWNRHSDTFTTFRHDKQRQESLASDFVRTLLVDSKDRIWIGTLDAGVDVLDPQTGRIQHLRHDPHTSESLINDQVYALVEDRGGEVWVGTTGGLDRWQLEKGGFVHSRTFDSSASPLSGKQVFQIAKGAHDTFWVSTFASGAFHLDKEGGLIENLRHSAADPKSLSSDEVHAILDDHQGHLWIGTAAGLDYVRQSDNRLDHYRHDKADTSSLSDSFVMSLYEDEAGLLWIGTRAGGVNRWNSHNWELGAIRPSWLDGKFVTSFADAGNNHLWIGSLGGGLVNFDLRTGDALDLETILHQDNALGDRRVMSLHRDRHGNLWIGTWAAGLKKLLPNGQLISVPVRAGDPSATSAPGIAAIYEARNGAIWIGTHGGGVNVLDPETGAINQLPSGSAAPGSTSSANITAFTEDLGGNIWIGTDGGGVDIARPDGMVIKVLSHEAANAQSLSANMVYALATDSSGHVWIASDGGGLDEVIGNSKNPESLEFHNFSHREGLSSDTLWGIVPDSAGHLWLSGNAGLMSFDLATHAVKTYHREQGVQGEEFDINAYHRTEAGLVCFGGPGGFNVFDPSQLSGETTPPRITLTGLEILGAPVQNLTPNWLLDRVSLGYSDTVVSFDFAALDFTSPTRNRLAYRVSGLTDKWIDLNSSRRVTLTNLDVGDHLLEVRAANSDSSWSTTPYHITIHKSAAPWRSVFAYIMYALVLVVVIVSILLVQRRNLRGALASKQTLESEVELRTKELREANRQLIVASEAKSAFLSRMGHELRTPMNGVVGMTELIARSPLSVTQSRQIQTIRTSARTLLRILNDLLDLSKAHAAKLDLESLPIDINQVIEESVAIFTGAAEAKRIDLVIWPSITTDVQLHGDPLRLRQILMNLIGNAVKFTERGEVIVTCDTGGLEGSRMQVVIKVTDTGVGISTAALQRIFEPFTQADETTTRRFGGTGLGLSICHQLVTLMGGTITVGSQPEIGSTFVVALPLRCVSDPGNVATPTDRDLIMLTRRPSLLESLRRYGQLLGLKVQARGPESLVRGSADEIVLLDADSYPDQIDRIRAARAGLPTVIVATSAAISVQKLETKVPDSLLLRSPVQREALLNAVGTSFPTADVTQSVRIRSELFLPPCVAHVLVVEDDEINAAVAEGYLVELSCTSVWVQDGNSALTRFRAERFDLILMDLNMPVLDGYETTRLLRASETNGQQVPIIALTANNAATYRQACLDAGMNDILTKPYSLTDCAAMLRRWAGHEETVTEVPPSLAVQGDLVAVNQQTVADMRSLGGSSQSNLYLKLVTVFKNKSGEALTRLGAALDKNQLDAARAMAHKLKGAAGNLGALSFAARLGELEHACLINDHAQAQLLFQTLIAAHPVLLDELAHLCLRESA
jgi:signal transduction histidine kinase/ligand-binding sensor domain-containing protein/CheY-like chemotaxis protein/HPt (histidine-containing phosphotransfer) domain-containing protein